MDTRDRASRERHRRLRRVLAAALIAAGALLPLTVACRAPEDLGPDPSTTPTSTATSFPATATPSASPAPSPNPTAVPTETPPPLPTAVPPANDLQELQERMAAEVAAYWMPGNYAVAVTDLQTMETAHVNGDRLQLSACVTNFFVLAQAALDVQNGRYEASLVDELMSATTWSSNAATARELYEIVGDGDPVAGVARVGELLKALGLELSIIDHPPSYPAQSLGIDDNNWVTAVEVNLGLAALWRGDLLEEPQRSDLLAKLEAVKPGLNYLTAIVPGTVSHKNGFFPGDTGYVDNDAGIVRFEADGEEYAFAITFLSEEVPEKYGDITLGQRLTWMAWEFFVERYGN